MPPNSEVNIPRLRGVDCDLLPKSYVKGLDQGSLKEREKQKKIKEVSRHFRKEDAEILFSLIEQEFGDDGNYEALSKLTLLKDNFLSGTRSANIEKDKSIVYYDETRWPGRPMDLPEAIVEGNALAVLENKYLRKDDSGKAIETPSMLFWRVAYNIAAAEVEFGASLEEVLTVARVYYMLIRNFFFLPNSPTFFGAGIGEGERKGQLAACFVLRVKDDLCDDVQSIMGTLLHAASIQQKGGGNGFDFSELRPKGSYIKSSGGVSTGPVGFMRLYNWCFEVILQGGTRRGANMAVLRVDHPDIWEFIMCKAIEGDLRNFNISVAITDEFMTALFNDTDFNLVNPHDKKVVKTVRARDIWNHIGKYAEKNGEPGVLFVDEANRHNPVPHLYQLCSTNPCGEQWLGPFENCCLGSIKLVEFVTEHINEFGQRVVSIDWEGLRNVIYVSTRFLDNVIEANGYAREVPQLRDAALRCRRIGLGIMDLAGMFYKLRIPYNSQRGEEVAAQVMEFVQYHSMCASVELARERGAFPAITGSVYDPNNFSWQVPQPIEPYKKNWFDRPALDEEAWNALVENIKAYGIRNCVTTTVAPTGTIASVAGVEGYGCEPVFALAYVRNMIDKSGAVIPLEYYSPSFLEALWDSLSYVTTEKDKDSINQTYVHFQGKKMYREELFEAIKKIVLNKGSCNVEELKGILSQEIREVFVVANDISGTSHIRLQAAIQAFVGNSMSKTINLEAGSTAKDVLAAFELAYKLKCKGCTVYITGSRDVVVLETKEEIQRKKDEKAKAGEMKKKETKNELKDESTDSLSIPNTRRVKVGNKEIVLRNKRDKYTAGITGEFKIHGGNMYPIVNHKNGQPFEVFFEKKSKNGTETSAICQALAILLSKYLRLRSPVPPILRLVDGIDSLLGIVGEAQVRQKGKKLLLSTPDAFAQYLRDYIFDFYIHLENGLYKKKIGSLDTFDFKARRQLIAMLKQLKWLENDPIFEIEEFESEKQEKMVMMVRRMVEDSERLSLSSDNDTDMDSDSEDENNSTMYGYEDEDPNGLMESLLTSCLQLCKNPECGKLGVMPTGNRCGICMHCGTSAC